jgi:nucleotide-binding universal stress UspA family protein
LVGRTVTLDLLAHVTKRKVGIMKTFKRILVTTDFSDISLAAMEYATPVSLTGDVEIYMINVVEPVALGDLHFANPDLVKELELNALRELKNFIESKLPGQGGIIPIVRIGDPAEEIDRFAEEQQIDLIIIASHGRSGLAHMVMGSVAIKIVRRSNIPVLTIKPESMQMKLVHGSDVEEQLHI